MFSNAAVFVVFVVLMDSFGHGRVTYLPCPRGWVSYEGSASCYKVPAQPTNNWFVARKNCLSMGGDLATISSRKENNFVGILLNTYFPATRWGWIGFIAALLSRQRNTGVMSCPGRLPSIRPARDLSLGATPKLNLNAKLGKRTFTPTIPARRVKEEPKEQESSGRGSSRKDRQHGGEGRGRGSGRGRGRGGRGRHEVVASQSVFSMGPAEKGKPGNSTPSASFTGGDRRESKTSKTSVKKEKNGDYNGDESQRILKMLETEDDDFEDEGTEYGMAPVSIPLSNYSFKIKELEEKKNIPFKDEPMEVDVDESEDKRPIKQKPVMRTEVKTEPDHPTCTQLFTTTDEPSEEKFIFIQLPDKLPIKPLDKATSNGISGSQTSEKANTKEQNNLSLKDVSEGYIGKLQVRKSGKTQLVFGGVTLDVAMGTSCSFLQELVTVHTDENRSDMTVLGPVKHRVICTPDFEKLLTA